MRAKFWLACGGCLIILAGVAYIVHLSLLPPPDIQIKGDEPTAVLWITLAISIISLVTGVLSLLKAWLDFARAKVTS